MHHNVQHSHGTTMASCDDDDNSFLIRTSNGKANLFSQGDGVQP